MKVGGVHPDMDGQKGLSHARTTWCMFKELSQLNQGLTGRGQETVPKTALCSDLILLNYPQSTLFIKS